MRAFTQAFLKAGLFAAVALISSGRAQDLRDRQKVVSSPVERGLAVQHVDADKRPPGLQQNVAVMVELNDPPATVAYVTALKAAQAQADTETTYALRHPKERRSQAILKSQKKVSISRQATAQVRAHLNRLEQMQQEILPSLTSTGIGGRIIYRVQRVYNGIALTVSADSISKIAQLPGVKAVHRLHAKIRNNTFSDLDFLNTRSLWTSLPGIHGEGIKIADIDTGIDYVHVNFGGSGALGDYGKAGVVPNPNFPSTKVPGGYDFAGDNYNGFNQPEPDPNPFDCDGHGTATASLIAGLGETNDDRTYKGSYDGSNPDIVSLRIPPGIAPKAQIYPLRVFGCFGATMLVTQALDWAIDPNGDGDFSDHMDVINMSLGSENGYADDPDALAASQAASMGILVCSAAGNDGDTYYIQGSPGAADGTLSVAATFNDQAGFLSDSNLTVNSPATNAGDKFSSIYGNPCPRVPAQGLTGNVVYGVPSDGNPERTTGPYTPLDNAAQLKGSICLIDRGGGITFATKCGRAQASGAVAVIVDNFNNPDANPITMGVGSGIGIPCVMIAKSARDAIVRAAGGFEPRTGLPAITVNLTIRNDNTPYVSNGGPADTIPTYSSRGPRVGDSAIKPDVSAPSEAVIVALNGTSNGIDTFNGTSSATPRVSGTMALLRQLHPTWSVQELNALVCNTATHDLFTSNNHESKYGVGRIGAGRVDLGNAAAANVVAFNGTDTNQVGISFGVVETPTDGAMTLTKIIVVENKGATKVTYKLTIDDNPGARGAEFSFPNGNTFTIAAGANATIPVTFSTVGSALWHEKEASVSLDIPNGGNRHWLTEAAGYAVLTPTDSSPVLRVALYAAPKPISTMHATSTDFVPTLASGSLKVNLTGTPVNTGATFPVDIKSLMKPFELQYASPLIGSSAEPVDPSNIKYVGITSDYVNATNKADTIIAFGMEGFGNAPVPEYEGSDKEVLIDTDRDGTYDFAIFLGTANLNVYFPVLVYLHSDDAVRIPIATNLINPVSNFDGSAGRDTNIFNNSAVLLGVPASLLADATVGLPPLDADAGFTQFNYQIVTFDRAGDLVDVTPLLHYDTAKPGLNPEESNVEPFVYNDLPKTSISVDYNIENLLQNGSLGLLLIHMHNGSGQRSEVVSLQKPLISYFYPSRGGPRTRVTIKGNYFNSGTVVNFADDQIAAVKVINSTTLIATVPPGATTGPITLSNPVGSSTSTSIFAIPGRQPVTRQPNLPSKNPLQQIREP